MKRKSNVLLLLVLFIATSFLAGIADTNALTNNPIDVVSNLNDDSDAFEHIIGAVGHTALAISEEDNLIFTQAPEGLAFIQRDDLSNQTYYSEEIGLSDVSISKIAIDKELKLLYIGYLMGVDVLNYSEMPLQAYPILGSVLANMVLTDFIKVDPVTHYVWITTQSDGVFVYDPISGIFVDTSGYNLPSPSVGIVTVEVNSTINKVYLGTEQGVFVLDTLTNTSSWITTNEGLPYNYTKVIKSCPEADKIFMSTFNIATERCGGLSVLFLSNDTIKNYNWTDNTPDINPRVIFDITLDPIRELGYIASPYSPSAEYGLLIFNTTDMTGIAKSDVGGSPSFGLTRISGSPDDFEGVLGSIELDEETRDVFVGSVRRIQKIYFLPPITATTESSPLRGLQQEAATDVNYDPIDDKFYVSTLLGLDRVDPYTHQIEYLISGAGASGGDTSGELLVNARLFYHNREVYDIAAGTWSSMNIILPEITEYNYIKDILSSENETILYYATGTEHLGLDANGSLLIFNRDTNFLHIEDFGFNKSELHVNRVLEDPNRDVLYVATNEYLILFNLTTLTEIKRFGGGLWDIRSLEWINERLWFGVEQYPNIRIFDPVTEFFSNFGLSSQILYPSINDIYYLEDRKEILILANSGLYVYNYTSGEMKYETETEGLSTLFVMRMYYFSNTGDAWIGTKDGGINIYDLDFDDRVPDIQLNIADFVQLSGSFSIEATSSDYSGIKIASLTIKNASMSYLLATGVEFFSHLLDTSLYDDGFYDIEANATDWNDLTYSLTITIEIDNIVISEFSGIYLLVSIPMLALFIILIKRKKHKL
ncbi:MAG: hypothetical protein ACTSQC_07050 [Candidatus Heimdallarchaeaceae archaeon]